MEFIYNALLNDASSMDKDDDDELRPSLRDLAGAAEALASAESDWDEKKRKGSNEWRLSCQADGCEVDLVDAKRYNRRHKVCPEHAKAQAVSVAGVLKRFCQQCSRFHGLPEFDGAKRSCRHMLAGHNARRRITGERPAEEVSVKKEPAVKESSPKRRDETPKTKKRTRTKSVSSLLSPRLCPAVGSRK